MLGECGSCFVQDRGKALQKKEAGSGGPNIWDTKYLDLQQISDFFLLFDQ